MKVLKAGNNIVDAFHGEGWEGHVRVRNIKGRWVYVSGDKALFPKTLKGLYAS